METLNIFGIFNHSSSFSNHFILDRVAVDPESGGGNTYQTIAGHHAHTQTGTYSYLGTILETASMFWGDRRKLENLEETHMDWTPWSCEVTTLPTVLPCNPF